MIANRTILIAVLLNAAIVTHANAVRDSSRIYLTKQQFDNDSAWYSCNCRVQEKGDFFWGDFRYEASGDLRVNTKVIKPCSAGSLYGFYMNKIKYVFVPSEKKYLAVLDNKLGVPLFVKEIEYIGYRTYFSNGLIVYLSPRNGMAVELNKKNLCSDFPSGTKLLDEMIKLNAKLEKYKSYISRKNFQKCQELTLEAH